MFCIQMKIVANWKMNLDFRESIELANKYLALTIPASFELIVLASDLVLQDLILKFKGSKIKVYAQDCSRFAEDGGYTGEISAKQLKSIGVPGVFLGHIERRKLVSETNEIVAIKLENALNAGLKTILGIGEVSKNLNFSNSILEIKAQLDTCLSKISEDLAKDKLSIAYESVNTISSLKSTTDKEDDLDLTIEKISFIKDYLSNKYPNISIKLMTGGSIDNADISALRRSELIDGILIGKKSLKYKEFEKMLKFLILQ